MLQAILEDKLEHVQRNLRDAENAQHMGEFKIWFEVEHQVKRIQKALELAS
jgi:hypothetical protein